MTTSDPVRCPECGLVDELDAFDVIGADDGCVFCNQCGNEFDPTDPEADPHWDNAGEPAGGPGE